MAPRVLTAVLLAAVVVCVSCNTAEVTDFGPASALNTPHGGVLMDLLASPGRAQQLIKEVSPSLPSLVLSRRQLCDVEMLLSGAFSPLKGFMDEATYTSVLTDMRLPSGLVWPMPLTLDVTADQAREYAVGDQVALRDQFFNLIAILTITDKWTPDKLAEAEAAFATTDISHPAVNYLFTTAGEVYLGGTLEGVRLPQHFDFNEIRFTPKQAREKFEKMGWGRFVAFQTRNPMHRAHIELTRRASQEIQGRVFINPVVGMTKPGDVDYATRVRCYQAVLKNADKYYGKNGVFLGLLPLAMRMAGPREALWHAIIRKNYGASHFVVGRDHAGCKSATGKDFYGPYDAQELVAKFKDEIGITIVPFKMLVYVPSTDTYEPVDQVADGTVTLRISGTKFRGMMAAGETIPPWFSDADVIRILTEVKPPKDRRGFTVFFSGLSGSGKTTIAAALVERLTAANPARPITVLDGDVVRTHLSKGLGFSVADRNTNIERIGWVAAEISKHRGIVIACPIAPFESSRATARELALHNGAGFAIVHVAASLEVCAERDVKGLYARADRGEIRLTGHSHPYEMPAASELVIDSGTVPVATSVDLIIGYLTKEGYLDDQEALKALEEHPEAVSAGEADPAARLCRSQRDAFVMAVSPVEADLAAIREVAEASGAFVEAIDEGTFRSIDDGSFKEQLLEVDVDARGAGFDVRYATGTPKTSQLSPEDRLEGAWWLYQHMRAAAQAGQATPLFTSPRLLVFAEHIMRFDPCARLVVVGRAAEEVVPVVAGEGDRDQASSYSHEFNSVAGALASAHPQRVLSVEGESLGEKSSLERVRRFAVPL